jgi:SAM-dependent methyltransferase
VKDSVAQFYRDNPGMVSSPFGGIHGVNEELFAEVFGALDIDLSNRDVLDVGCGRGFVGELVERAGGRYTGMDFVTSRSGFSLTVADAAHIPFADGAFDAVFCIDAFEHMPEPATCAAEFRRVLRDGGFFFLSAPNYANMAGVIKWSYEALGLYEKNTWAPFGRWQPQEFESPVTSQRITRLFRGAGFPTIRRVGYGAEVGLGLLPWIDHPRMPEAIQFRMQRLFRKIGPPIAQVWPDASLHVFYKMEV